jgi:SAM-dependent methyltransferase
MNEALEGQVSRSAAEVYEEFFVPSLFLEPARRIAERAGIASSHAILDVACGTGALARQAAHYVGESGSVTGLDRNEGMLAVARRISPQIDWRHGLAEKLPFADQSFDRVLCQFGFMFFDDPEIALREMKRVSKPGARVLAAVWGALAQSPGYNDMANLLERLFGTPAADALRTPFRLGNIERLRQIFTAADIQNIRIEPIPVTARFSSLEAWMHTEIKGWTLADMIDEPQYQVLLAAARKSLAQFEAADGSVSFSSPALLVMFETPHR